MISRDSSDRYFIVMAYVMIGFVVAGFGLFALRGFSSPTDLPALLHVHAFAFLGWFALFAVQASLIGRGNVPLHMMIGKASAALALLMLLLGYIVIRHAVAKPDWSIAGLSPAGSTIFPVTDMVNFSICYGLAIYHRRTAIAHKRLVLLAGILILDPAFARLMISIGAPVPLSTLIFVGLLGSLVVYDFRKLGRPHWASLLGIGLFVAAMLSKFTLAQTAGWERFVHAAFG